MTYQRVEIELKKDGLEELFVELESRVTPILAVMEGEGLGVERKGISEMSHVLNGQIGRIEKEAHTLAQRPFQLTSPVQVRYTYFILVK